MNATSPLNGEAHNTHCSRCVSRCTDPPGRLEREGGGGRGGGGGGQKESKWGGTREEGKMIYVNMETSLCVTEPYLWAGHYIIAPRTHERERDTENYRERYH